MRRTFLVILLAALVVGAAALKTWWDDYRLERRVTAERAALEEQTARLEAEVDSLVRELDAARLLLDSMLCLQEEAHAAVFDSLARAIDSQQVRIAELTAGLDSARRRLTVVRARSERKKRPSGIGHAEVLEFFRRQYARLPGDLTAYERKVALQELKEKTARRFSLTVSQVDRIVDSAGLVQ